MAKSNKKEPVEPVSIKVLDVDASMQGTLAFHDPVNLRINGNFEGKLDTKGSLSVGENSTVRADITGDRIIVAGTVFGNIVAAESVSLIAPGNVQGDIRTPVLSVGEGAVLNGTITMNSGNTGAGKNELLTLKDVAQYLEVETKILEEWAQKKKIPATYENDSWKFRKAEIDRWIQEEKIRV